MNYSNNSLSFHVLLAFSFSICHMDAGKHFFHISFFESLFCLKFCFNINILCIILYKKYLLPSLYTYGSFLATTSLLVFFLMISVCVCVCVCVLCRKAYSMIASKFKPS